MALRHVRPADLAAGGRNAPQRRALVIGVSVALLFLVLQIIFLTLTFVAQDATGLQTAIRWAFAAARALIWYGFLFALIAAQLFAARAMQRLVGQSLSRPSRLELEAMLRDRSATQGCSWFVDPKASAVADAGDDVLDAGTGPGRDLTSSSTMGGRRSRSSMTRS